VLILDEVVTGFGRLGHFMAAEPVFGMQADLITLGKGISSGYQPLSATLVSDRINDVIASSEDPDRIYAHGFTHSGHPVCCAAGLANIDIIERDGLLENSRLMGARLLDGVNALVDEFPNIDNARGLGLMAGFDVVKSKESREGAPDRAEKISAAALEMGLRARPIAQAIAFAPPLCISADEVDFIINTMGDAITRASG